MSKDIFVRPARPEDCTTIIGLLGALAAFEGASGAVTITEQVICRDGFGDNRRFEVLLAEVDGRVRGMAILYQAYSSWQGAPTLVVHDLFVEKEARRSGAGKALLTAAARLAGERGCCRIDVNVLGRNAKARRFYGALGFSPLSDWMPYRLDGGRMRRLAEGR